MKLKKNTKITKVDNGGIFHCKDENEELLKCMFKDASEWGSSAESDDEVTSRRLPSPKTVGRSPRIPQGREQSPF